MHPTSVDDAEFIFRLINSPKWLKYIGDRKVKSVAQAKTYIEQRMLGQLHRLGYGNYTIITKEDNKKIGTCGLYDRTGLEGIDIGYALLSEHENKGYATEAAQKIRDVAYKDFGLHHLRAITTKDNLASQKLLEKIKFTYSKIINLPDDPEDLLLYEFFHK